MYRHPGRYQNARHIFAESQQLKYTGCVFEFRDGRPFREQILETIRPGIRSIYEEAGEPGSRFRRVHLSAVKLEAVDFSFGNQPEKSGTALAASAISSRFCRGTISR